ncbi:MAG: response regulator transcription factor [Sphingobacteriales bacterium]|nr:MAG: response regulator transcription factor [Sphingobacteriales bacterium]
MIRAVIIDDEIHNIDNLRGLLRQYSPSINVTGTAMNAVDGVNIIREQDPQLVFLDIQMPGKNGFELLADLSEHNFEIILVTAYDNYGIQAVKFSALDYLLKPINIADLTNAVVKAEKRIREKQKNLELANLLKLVSNREEKSNHRLALPTLRETRFVNPRDIIRCESSNAYTSFFLSSEEKIVVSKPIYEYEELLADFGFLRCHQSHLVNINFINSWLKKDGDYLVLKNGQQIPVSRNKKEMMNQRLIHLK